MLILAFESSAKPASVALLQDGKLLSQYLQCSALTHSRTLLPMAEDMLKNAELSLADVDLLAVAHGPGSFTGIRIGVSAVKGLAWAGDKPCVGVSTLEAMAWNGSSFEGYVCPVMDARRSQVYNAIFKIENGMPVRATEDRPIALEELEKEVRALEAPVLLVGDGAELTKKYFDAHGIASKLSPENLRWQTAWGVAMAAQFKTPCNVDGFCPCISDSVRQRENALRGSPRAQNKLFIIF